jgi:hypothetical protein
VTDNQGFAADLFTTLHCPTALVVRTSDQPLAAQQMKLLEEGASVIEWIAIVRPSSKNRALAAGTRRLVATARTRYLGFGTVKTEPIQNFQSTSQRPRSINTFMTPSQLPQPQRNGSWSSDFTQTQNSYQGQAQRPDTSPTTSSVMNGNGFDWSSFPVFGNVPINQAIPQHQPQQQPQQHMQMLPVGQLSPIDMSLPLSSPTGQGYQQTFGHLPMMPNQMDNWPMSMQNLGQLGVTPATDPYAPSSEGFDMWLASILSDNGGTGNGGNQGQGQGGYQ